MGSPEGQACVEKRAEILSLSCDLMEMAHEVAKQTHMIVNTLVGPAPPMDKGEEPVQECASGKIRAAMTALASITESVTRL